MPVSHAEQAVRGDRFVGALDADHLRFTQRRCAIDQSRGGDAEHHPAGRSDRFHPLGHPHLLTDGGVTERPRTDLAGDHLTGVQPHPQLQLHTVTVVDVGGESLRLDLDAQRSQTRAIRVILQGHGSAEHRHDPVAGELRDRAAVTLHHCRRAAHQLSHDLAQPLGTDRRRDVHRMNDVGEQHRHLLVLR